MCQNDDVRYFIKKWAFLKTQTGVRSFINRFHCDFYLTRLDPARDILGDVMILPMADNKKFRWSGLTPETYYLPFALYSKDLINRRQILGCTRWIFQIYRKDIQLKKEKQIAKKYHYGRLFKEELAKGHPISRLELRLKHEQACAKYSKKFLQYGSEAELVADIFSTWGKKHQFLKKNRQGQWLMYDYFRKLFSIPKEPPPRVKTV